MCTAQCGTGNVYHQAKYQAEGIDLSYFVLDHIVRKQQSGQFLQVQARNDSVQQAYKRLQSTAMVTKLGVTFDELVWAVDVVTSRSFAIPKHWLETVQGERISCLDVVDQQALCILLFGNK